ncbi:ABC transporter permease [Actibacterium mucosum KCTC 23349]|uniref:ABC transporter permease n=1 Tax=Actibacterium mucosum KCTC 23349 TaxID=1454373 RepID=A0A037ZI05_9RHOB|nr:carbohydrate ABC transporter permease [Actibacterium mucosum]KAJ54400.1 ABC transporter permease [Actibacterium mucosum KCTC 23349]
MSGLTTFLGRTHGRGRLSLYDWLSYGYLLLGVLVMLVPVLWLVANSFKSNFQLQSLDTSLLPYEYERIGRATVYGPDGREIFFIEDLPGWALRWNELDDEERAAHDPVALLNQFEGREYYGLRSQLGLTTVMTRALVAERGLPEWIMRYPSLFGAQKNQFDPQPVLDSLQGEDRRLLAEYLSLEGYKPNTFTSQIVVTGPDPETGEPGLFAVTRVDATKEITRVRSVSQPERGVLKMPTETLSISRNVSPSWGNYSEPLGDEHGGESFDALRCLGNSVFVTIVATIITVLINAMAAFALSKYRFRGQISFYVIILSALMVPASVLMVGIFKMVTATGLAGNLWGVILPACATPVGVFMLRQYMLTIPDELLDAARMDAASEWSIFWRMVFPLSLPAIAALTILSIIWRWNDLIMPMIAVSTNKEAYTIQMCLLVFNGEFFDATHYKLAMTVISLLPTTLVFVFLQKYIASGIANTGIK